MSNDLKSPHISVVSPVYQSEATVDELVARIAESVSGITADYEIILVDDGSVDASWQKIADNCKSDPHVRGIKFSRNFGQHYAILAGLAASKGDFAIVLDCDLQDDPRYIADLLEKSAEGYDIVYTVKKRREHGVAQNLFANLFHRIYNWLVDDKNISSGGLVGAYSLITRKVVDNYCQINDYYRPYIPTLNWLGFSSAYITIEHSKRPIGKSSYTLMKRFAHAFNAIISQTDKMLMLSTYGGFLFTFVGFVSIIYIAIRYLTSGFAAGWASVVSLIILSTGLILSSLGIIGMYLSKVYLQTKNRPLYIVDEAIN
ncbi:MAG: glycosyltransferase family 2 protein [Chloroflexi bacterium]|nr:glycosyltransferase family 2 protein [Chloroflexota bacterium]